VSDEPAWHEVIEAAKQNRLGVDEDAPVAKPDENDIAESGHRREKQKILSKRNRKKSAS